MALKVVPQPGEEVHFQREYRFGRGRVFAIVISNQAIYLPAPKSLAALNLPLYFERVPLQEVKEVRWVRSRPVLFYLLSSLIVVMLLVAIYLVAVGLVEVREPWFLLLPALLGAGYVLYIGLAIPFAARGLRTLVVRMRDREFRWTSPPPLTKALREQNARMQEEIIEACHRAGIPTVVED